MIRYGIPMEYEPRMEAWLEKRGIPFEVCSSRKPERLVMMVQFEACTDVKEQNRIREMFENQIRKIPGGKILKNKGG